MTGDALSPEAVAVLKAGYAGHSGAKSRRLYLALYDLLASAQLAADTQLPASRVLAPVLGVGRNTVTATYQQLADEGLLYTAQRGGTRVRAQTGAAPATGERLGPETACGGRLSRRATADAVRERPLALCPGEPDSTLFPRQAWSRALARAGRSADAKLGYRYDAGEPTLREAIARYLASWRSLSVDPACVLITASTRQSLAIAAGLYADPGDTAWVESPGYSGASQAWRLLGLQLKPLAVDGEGLVCPADLAGARLLYATPCFQYPAGHGLAPARRRALLARAADAGTVVFEDDYDSEFRDDSQPRPALASAAASQGATVVHAGTFSKLMFPAVRLGWMVLPVGHVPAAMGVMRSLGGGHNAVQQRAVASLLDDGTVARHLVRARAEYGRRRRALIDTLANSPLRVRNGSGGLSLVIDLPAPVDRGRLVRALHGHGLGAHPLEALDLNADSASPCRALVVGTGNLAVADTVCAAGRLIDAWQAVHPLA
ncbi:MAG: PLP-dependent aminotransferase family protein [Pseudomonadota bacterium]